MKNLINNVDKLAKVIEIFSRPCHIHSAANKMFCTERTVYRLILSMENDGFTFEKIGFGYRITSVPESATIAVMNLANQLLSMSIK